MSNPTLSTTVDKRRRRTAVRRTATEVEALERQILDVLEEDHPQSVRHVFYRMTNPRLPEPVEKSDYGYRHVQNRLTLMRRAGRVPYNWITDATRYGYFTDTYRNAAEFLNKVKSLYRADLWRASDHYCEVWVESRSIAGVVRNDRRELAVNLYPAGGFSSISFAYEAAEYLADSCGGRPTTIFYIGDYDPAGVLIDRSIESELRRHLPADVVLTFRRIGITEAQIQQYDLPRKPRKDGELRAQEITSTVEAEAMPAAIMRQLLREAIEGLLPANALAVARVTEQSERALLGSLAQLAAGGAA